MRSSTLLASTLALYGAARAHRPANVTICDHYTPLVTGKENSAASQRELMLTITHTFILGNYTTPNVGIPVAGIAAPATFQGHDVYLLPYFTGGYASTNLGGPHGAVKNFLDDGGAVPLSMDEPANGTRSNQYALLTHVYQYFGAFYQCSHQGRAGDPPTFPAYQGRTSMFAVHEYMAISAHEFGFFASQIVAAVASLGFEDADVSYTNASLYAAFGHRCAPPDAHAELQAICVAGGCPLAEPAACGLYPDGGPVALPVVANASLVGTVGVKGAETAAATAEWPVHCKRDGDGEGCAFATATTSGAASTASGNAAVAAVRRWWAAGDARRILEFVALAVVLVGAGGGVVAM